MKALTHWRHYLGWTKTPFTILTDHANLQYWKAPQKLNRRMARWHANLQEYNFIIKHIPGVMNPTLLFRSVTNIRHLVGLACTTWTGVSREPDYL